MIGLLEEIADYFFGVKSFKALNYERHLRTEFSSNELINYERGEIDRIKRKLLLSKFIPNIAVGAALTKLIYDVEIGDMMIACMYLCEVARIGCHQNVRTDLYFRDNENKAMIDRTAAELNNDDIRAKNARADYYKGE